MTAVFVLAHFTGSDSPNYGLTPTYPDTHTVNQSAEDGVRGSAVAMSLKQLKLSVRQMNGQSAAATASVGAAGQPNLSAHSNISTLCRVKCFSHSLHVRIHLMAARWQCCSLSSASEPSGPGRYIDPTVSSEYSRRYVYTLVAPVDHQKTILVMMSPQFVVMCVCI